MVLLCKVEVDLARRDGGTNTGRVLSSEFWPELQFLAQLLLGGIMLTSF